MKPKYRRKQRNTQAKWMYITVDKAHKILINANSTTSEEYAEREIVSE